MLLGEQIHYTIIYCSSCKILLPIKKDLVRKKPINTAVKSFQIEC